MKVFYATDLHGQIPKFECVKKIIDDHDIIILGADLLPKGIGASTQRINDFIHEYLPTFFNHFYNIPIILDFGNDDWMIYYKGFEDVVSRFHGVHISNMNTIEIGDYKFCGMNYVPDYPFGIKDWCRRDGEKIADEVQFGTPYYSYGKLIIEIDYLEEHLESMPKIMDYLNLLPKPEPNIIYLIHSPPYGTGLDQCFRVGAVGSMDVRDWIQKEKPFLTLHGHIHESFELTNKDLIRIGNSICINPGQKGGGGRQPRMFVWSEFDLNDVIGTFKRKEMRE
jgi:Icc-related predicted phosphoesterase